jgi:hypothetical protein
MNSEDGSSKETTESFAKYSKKVNLAMFSLTDYRGALTLIFFFLSLLNCISGFYTFVHLTVEKSATSNQEFYEMMETFSQTMFRSKLMLIGSLTLLQVAKLKSSDWSDDQNLKQLSMMNKSILGGDFDASKLMISSILNDTIEEFNEFNYELSETQVVADMKFTSDMIAYHLKLESTYYNPSSQTSSPVDNIETISHPLLAIRFLISNFKKIESYAENLAKLLETRTLSIVTPSQEVVELNKLLDREIMTMVTNSFLNIFQATDHVYQGLGKVLNEDQPKAFLKNLIAFSSVYLGTMLLYVIANLWNQFHAWRNAKSVVQTYCLLTGEEIAYHEHGLAARREFFRSNLMEDKLMFEFDIDPKFRMREPKTPIMVPPTPIPISQFQNEINSPLKSKKNTRVAKQKKEEKIKPVDQSASPSRLKQEVGKKPIYQRGIHRSMRMVNDRVNSGVVMTLVTTFCLAAVFILLLAFCIILSLNLYKIFEFNELYMAHSQRILALSDSQIRFELFMQFGNYYVKDPPEVEKERAKLAVNQFNSFWIDNKSAHSKLISTGYRKILRLLNDNACDFEVEEEENEEEEEEEEIESAVSRVCRRPSLYTSSRGLIYFLIHCNSVQERIRSEVVAEVSPTALADTNKEPAFIGKNYWFSEEASAFRVGQSQLLFQFFLTISEVFDEMIVVSIEEVVDLLKQVGTFIPFVVVSLAGILLVISMILSKHDNLYCYETFKIIRPEIIASNHYISNKFKQYYDYS